MPRRLALANTAVLHAQSGRLIGFLNRRPMLGAGANFVQKDAGFMQDLPLRGSDIWLEIACP